MITKKDKISAKKQDEGYHAPFQISQNYITNVSKATLIRLLNQAVHSPQFNYHLSLQESCTIDRHGPSEMALLQSPTYPKYYPFKLAAIIPVIKSSIISIKIFPYTQNVISIVCAVITLQQLLVTSISPSKFTSTNNISVIETSKSSVKFTCAEWAVIREHGSMSPIIIIGNNAANIAAFNCKTNQLHWEMKAHCNSITDIKTHPSCYHIVLSSSKDYTAIIWNIDTKQQLAIFHPFSEQISPIISVCWSMDGKFFISASKGHVRVWEIDSKLHKLITTNSSIKTTQIIYSALYFTSGFHDYPIDCCAFIGFLICTKSRDNKIKIWKPNAQFGGKGISIIKEYNIPQAYLTYSKGAFEVSEHLMAAANPSGEIYIYDLYTKSSLISQTNYVQKITMDSFSLTALAFSADRQYLICGSDDGRLSLYRI